MCVSSQLKVLFIPQHLEIIVHFLDNVFIMLMFHRLLKTHKYAQVYKFLSGY